jgi:hypothetical protein
MWIIGGGALLCLFGVVFVVVAVNAPPKQGIDFLQGVIGSCGGIVAGVVFFLAGLLFAAVGFGVTIGASARPSDSSPPPAHRSIPPPEPPGSEEGSG